MEDDFHVLQLKPITKISALKRKKNKQKTKYLTPERACELEVKTSLWQQGLLVTRGRSKYIQRYSKYI